MLIKMEAWEVTDSPNMNRPGSLRAPEGTKYGLFHRAPALALRVTLWSTLFWHLRTNFDL